ncbi:hypothetical protein DFQ26_006995 [Actinomortierella ambigua]|nr:hypothetical protein DFQ26_006995 [Actinomortierella ambigua]
MLSSTGSSPTAPTFSEASTAASSPTSPTSSTNLPSPSSPSTAYDLASTEATYISSLKSVSDTLTQVSGNVLASGRKDSASHRSLIKRWNELIRVHSSFHEVWN